MLSATEPGVEIISAMVATQLMKTELLTNIFGFHAHLDPCPILLVQPKEEAAEAFSKERLGPMIKATPVLKALVGDGRTRRSDDTLVYKAFPGGFVALVGAGSPTNLASRPVRLVLYDEIDKYLPLANPNLLQLSVFAQLNGLRAVFSCRLGITRYSRRFQCVTETIRPFPASPVRNVFAWRTQ